MTLFEVSYRLKQPKCPDLHVFSYRENSTPSECLTIVIEDLLPLFCFLPCTYPWNSDLAHACSHDNQTIAKEKNCNSTCFSSSVQSLSSAHSALFFWLILFLSLSRSRRLVFSHHTMELPLRLKETLGFTSIAAFGSIHIVFSSHVCAFRFFFYIKKRRET